MLGIDLFAGAGGLSLGFEAAGFEIFYCNEIDKYASETYSFNRSNNVFVDTKPIEELDADAILAAKHLRPGELDIVIGGPPCQGFSQSNTKTRNSQNPSNSLVYKYVDMVEKLLPKWILMENVAGLTTFEGGLVIQDLQHKFLQLGYASVVVVLNAANFGVPQNRNRTFIVGNRTGESLDEIKELEMQQCTAKVTVADALFDLPSLSNGNRTDVIPYRIQPANPFQEAMRAGNDRDEVSNNLTTAHSLLSITRFSNIMVGENLQSLHKRRPDLVANYKKIENCHHWIYLRLDSTKPSVALNNFRKNMLIHPTENRGLSVREAARLQSFPDDYIFRGPLGFQQQQVANAVPPLLAKSVAKTITAISERNNNAENNG